MTTLPATLITTEIAAARQCAEQLVEQLLDEDLLHIGVPTLHPDAGQVDACGKIKHLFQGAPCFRAEILTAALNGYLPARIALGELVQEIPEREWPSELATYAKASANPHHRWPQKPGSKRFANVYADIGVVMVLLELHKRFPSIPVSSQSGRRVCHADIVAEVFTRYRHRIGRGAMSRMRAMKLWNRYRTLTIRKMQDQKLLNVFN